MANAKCLCGALSLKLRETSKLIVACHCLACQRRTGSPFGLGVFHAIDTVEITRTATEFIHVGDSGRKVRCYSCPTCGSTVYWKPDVLPSLIGVAVGALGDPAFRLPPFRYSSGRSIIGSMLRQPSIFRRAACKKVPERRDGEVQKPPSMISRVPYTGDPPRLTPPTPFVAQKSSRPCENTGSGADDCCTNPPCRRRP